MTGNNPHCDHVSRTHVGQAMIDLTPITSSLTGTAQLLVRPQNPAILARADSAVGGALIVGRLRLRHQHLFGGYQVRTADIEPRRPSRFDDNRRRDLLDDGRPFDRGAGAELRAVIDRRVDQLAVRRH